MCAITNLHKLQMLLGTAFVRFFLELENMELNQGIVLIAEDEEQLFDLVKRLKAMEDFVVFTKTNKNSPLNFQINAVVWKNGKKSQDVISILQDDTCLPVVLVAGVVPAILYEEGYPVKININESDWQKFLKQFHWFVEKVKEHPEHVMKQVERTASSRLIKDMSGIPHSRFLKTCFSVGRIWEFFLFDQIGEEKSSEWFEDYFNTCKQMAEDIKNFESGYDSSEAVARCIFEAVENGDIKISEEFKENDDDTIIYENEQYYVPEYLLQKICLKLLSGVSFRQLKQEMREVGMLGSSGENNYTKKKVFVDSSTNKTCRKRFLCIPENYLYDDTGLNLIDFYYLNMNQAEKEGGVLSCQGKL